MTKRQHAFNGIDGSTGDYIDPNLTIEDIARLARGESLDGSRDVDHARELEARRFRDTEAHYGPIEGVDAEDLASSGWGVLFPHNIAPEVVEALRPLLEHRKAQASREHERRYQEYLRERGYRVDDPRESKRTWLSRHRAAAGMPADPDRVPYYLMIVSDVESVPYSFQYQLDVEYAVGRLWFETPDGRPDLDAFANYARAVVAAETGAVARQRKATFVAVCNEDDPATELSSKHLVAPLLSNLKQMQLDWEFSLASGQEARKADLASLLNGPDSPALLFTASHGMQFPWDDERQLPHQGALLCQDWPGRIAWRGPIPAEHYFAADDVADSARLSGMIAFLFACYGGGTPRLNDFAHLARLRDRSAIAPRPFIARLPQRLLGHPGGGALAVVGHVERAWSCSFYGNPQKSEQLQVFQSTLTRLLKGARIGYAMEFFNQYYAAVAAELSAELEDIQYGKAPEDRLLAAMWTANNDARSYLVFGDPAVRLRSGEAGVERAG